MERELLSPTPRPVRIAPSIRRTQKILLNAAGAAVLAINLIYLNRHSLPLTNASLFCAFLFFLIVSFIVYAIWLDVDSRDCQHLLRIGIAVEGYVLDQLPDATGTPGVTGNEGSLRYGYMIPDGRSFEGAALFPRALYSSHPKGGSLTILYDPKDPGRHMPYVLIHRAEVAGTPVH